MLDHPSEDLADDPDRAATTRFLKGRIPAGARISAPPLFAHLGPLLPPSAVPLPDWAVVDEATPLPLIRQLLAQSTPVHANARYVVFARRPTFGLTDQRDTPEVRALADRIATAAAPLAGPLLPSLVPAPAEVHHAPDAPPPASDLLGHTSSGSEPTSAVPSPVSASRAEHPTAASPDPKRPSPILPAAPSVLAPTPWRPLSRPAPVAPRPGPVPSRPSLTSQASSDGTRDAWQRAPTASPPRPAPTVQVGEASLAVVPFPPAASPPVDHPRLPAEAQRATPPSSGPASPPVPAITAPSLPAARSPWESGIVPVPPGLPGRILALIGEVPVRSVASIGDAASLAAAFPPAVTVRPAGEVDVAQGVHLVLVMDPDPASLPESLFHAARLLRPGGAAIIVAENAASLGRRLVRAMGRDATGGITAARLRAAVLGAGLRPALMEGFSLDVWRATASTPPDELAEGPAADLLDAAGRDAGPDHAARLLLLAHLA